MNTVAKRYISVILVVVLTLHFLVSFLYSSPIVIENKKINFVVQTYSYPYFHQSWSLFVPVPKKQFTLMYRYKNNTIWSDWKSLTNLLIKKQRHTIFLGYDAKVVLFANSLNYYENEVENETRCFGSKIMANQTLAYAILMHEIKNYIINTNQLSTLQDFEVLYTLKYNNSTHYSSFKNDAEL